MIAVALSVPPVARNVAAFLPPLHPAADGATLAATIAICAALAGLVFSLLALWLYIRLINARRQARFDGEQAHREIEFRDGLLAVDGESVAILTPGSRQTPSSNDASILLKKAIGGPDSRRVATALSGLMQNGVPFQLTARDETTGHAIAIRGAVASGRAAVFTRNSGTHLPPVDFHTALDSLPVPVWVRGTNLALRWANRAFLDITGAKDLQSALNSNLALQRSEIDLAAAVLESAGSIDALRYALVDGERRAFSLKLASMPDSVVLACAVDVTDKARAESALQLSTEAAADMLDGLSTAVAVFDDVQRLQSYNAVYAQMWGFPEEWLDAHPALAEILDRLRETRQLPEKHDYAEWKNEQLRLFKDCVDRSEEFWHLAGGRSFRVLIRPHLLGGVAVLIDDISEKFQLESSFKMLLQVQRATLDTVEDAIAIFGPDGRLVLFNTNFVKLWRFTEDELCGQPHFTKVASLAEGRLGRDGLWSIVSLGVTSAEPDRCNDWGTIARADGRVISLSLSRLPNGATIAIFCDLTDLERFREHPRKTPFVAA